MKKLAYRFTHAKMGWGKVLLLAVITAVYTALINQVKFLDDTSFQDIAINPECWLLFAVFIIINCKKQWEAVAKCFVFFLISQPLVYLIEVPFLGWSVFGYYDYWFKITLLTIPGAFVAFWVKKKNFLSAAVLSVACVLLGYLFVTYLKTVLWNFPYHLLSTLFCLALAAFLIYALLNKKSHRGFVWAVFLIAVVITSVITGLHFGKDTEMLELGGGTWQVTVEKEEIISAEMTDGDTAKITAEGAGTSYLTFESGDGEVVEYLVTVSGGNLWIDKME